MSLENIFGNADSLVLAPPSGPAYPGGELRPRAHFINCHGGTASPEFLGQKGEKYPASLTTQTTAGEIAEGTVAAVECCYGAELYDAETLAIDPPICQSYLRQGAYGYLGSTTIAYGPVDENGAADLICQYFLINVLAGASIGRAALLARQQFVEQTAQMDPFDLKTLAQFCLLGDPSVHPVGAVAEGSTQKGKAARDVDRFSRSERREKMALTGAFLKASKPTASKRAPSDKLSSASRQALANIAKLAGLKATQVFTAFAVNRPGGAKSGTAKAGSVPTRYLLTLGKGSNAAANDNVKVNRGVAVIAKVLNGRIVGSRIYHQR